MSPGNIILLNGTSSSGKTTIAKALQHCMNDPYYLQGMDMLQPGFPPGVLRYRDETSIDTVEGWDIVFHEDRLMEVHPGAGAIRFITGMYRSFAAFASAGNHLIVDDVIYHREIFRAVVRELHDANVLFVGVFLPLEVAEQRERDRGNRALGGARTFYHGVHLHGLYDLVIDSSTASSEECAQQIQKAIEEDQPRTALQELWRSMQM
jgi:chloramphenicol 3-O phosphotransferase